jgi:hypothetical protein
MNPGSWVNLPCGNNELVIVSKVLNSNLPKIKCDFDSTNEACKSEHEDDLQRKCNGEQSCIFKISKSKNESSLPLQIRIIYSCIPSKLRIDAKLWF